MAHIALFHFIVAVHGNYGNYLKRFGMQQELPVEDTPYFAKK